MPIAIEFIPSKLLMGKEEGEKIRFILDTVKKDKILVLEAALTPVEEKNLIKKTMENVRSDFSGIEIATLGSFEDGIKAALVKMLGGKMGGLTVVGPSNLVKQIKRDPNKLSLLAGQR